VHDEERVSVLMNKASRNAKTTSIVVLSSENTQKQVYERLGQEGTYELATAG